VYNFTPKSEPEVNARIVSFVHRHTLVRDLKLLVDQLELILHVRAIQPVISVMASRLILQVNKHYPVRRETPGDLVELQ